MTRYDVGFQAQSGQCRADSHSSQGKCTFFTVQMRYVRSRLFELRSCAVRLQHHLCLPALFH
jgi:hypothetical protein